MGRLVAQKMSGSIGQPVSIENKPGASGIIAAPHAISDQHLMKWLSEFSSDMRRRPSAFQSVLQQRGRAIDPMRELPIGQRKEQRKHHA